MSEDITSNESLTEQDYDAMLKKIKKKKAEKYKFTLNGGESYKGALFCLYKKVWECEQKPTSWENTSCTMLYKGKGLKSEFPNQRFIHSKEEITLVSQPIRLILVDWFIFHFFLRPSSIFFLRSSSGFF